MPNRKGHTRKVKKNGMKCTTRVKPHKTKKRKK